MVTMSPDGVSGSDGWFAPPPGHGPFLPADPPKPAHPEQAYAEPADAEPAEHATAETLLDPLAEADLATLLSSALETLRAESVADLAAAGYVELDPPSARAFAELQAQGGCTSSDLATALGLTAQETTHLLKDLERRGYLKRDPSPRGPRHVRFVLNDRALQQLRASGYVQARLAARLADRLGPEVLAGLRDGLIRVIRG